MNGINPDLLFCMYYIQFILVLCEQREVSMNQRETLSDAK